MADALLEIGNKIFDYLWTENAPFTVLLIGVVIALVLMWKRFSRGEKLRQEAEIKGLIFEAQMQHYDDSISVVLQVLKSNFMALRKDVLLEEEVGKLQKRKKRVVSAAEYKRVEARVYSSLSTDSEVDRFTHILGNTRENAITPFFRRIYHANHLTEMTEIEFEHHMDDRVAQALQACNDDIEDRYWDKTVPDKVALYKSHQVVYPNVAEKLKDILRHARKIAEEMREEHSPSPKNDHFISVKIGG